MIIAHWSDMSIHAPPLATSEYEEMYSTSATRVNDTEEQADDRWKDRWTDALAFAHQQTKKQIARIYGKVTT